LGTDGFREQLHHRLLTGQLRKRKFTYAKSLLAQLQTSEQEPPGAA
jgi:DNA-binding SARP family transcriptional activator